MLTVSGFIPPVTRKSTHTEFGADVNTFTFRAAIGCVGPGEGLGLGGVGDGEGEGERPGPGLGETPGLGELGFGE
jgi:hypothetical protein